MSKLWLIVTTLPLAACAGETIQVGMDPPPQSWMVCKPLPDRPDLTALVPFTLSDGRQVYLKDAVDDRDSHIADYVLQVRGAWFDCASSLERVRGYYE